MIKWDQLAWEYHAPGQDEVDNADGQGLSGEYFYRFPVRSVANWVKTIDVTFALNQNPCARVKWRAAAALVDCTLDRPASLGQKFLLTASAGAAEAPTKFRSTGTMLLALETAGGLVPNDGSRNLVWTGAPVFTPRCRHVSWTRVAAWAEQWRKAGFHDLVVHARESSFCRGLRSRGLGCVYRPSHVADSALSVLQPRGHVERRDYSDQSWNNMVGLAQARAAGYGMVAFVDLGNSQSRSGQLDSPRPS